MSNISAILLAGGRSKRMGKDKAFLKLGNKTFLRYILEKLDIYCEEIVIVGNKEKDIYLSQAIKLKAKVIFTKDLYPYEGPLNGIITGYKYIKNEFTFISTCDTPLLVPQIIPFLKEKVKNYDMVIPIIKGKFQPLNTIYRTFSLEKAKSLFNYGNRSLFSFIKQSNPVYIEEKEIKKVDKELFSYWSINTPEDYQKLTQQVQQVP